MDWLVFQNELEKYQSRAFMNLLMIKYLKDQGYTIHVSQTPVLDKDDDKDAKIGAEIKQRKIYEWISAPVLNPEQKKNVQMKIESGESTKEEKIAVRKADQREKLKEESDISDGEIYVTRNLNTQMDNLYCELNLDVKAVLAVDLQRVTNAEKLHQVRFVKLKYIKEIVCPTLGIKNTFDRETVIPREKVEILGNVLSNNFVQVKSIFNLRCAKPNPASYQSITGCLKSILTEWSHCKLMAEIKKGKRVLSYKLFEESESFDEVFKSRKDMNRSGVIPFLCLINNAKKQDVPLTS